MCLYPSVKVAMLTLGVVEIGAVGSRKTEDRLASTRKEASTASHSPDIRTALKACDIRSGTVGYDRYTACTVRQHATRSRRGPWGSQADGIRRASCSLRGSSHGPEDTDPVRAATDGSFVPGARDIAVGLVPGSLSADEATAPALVSLLHARVEYGAVGGLPACILAFPDGEIGVCAAYLLLQDGEAGIVVNVAAERLPRSR